MKMRKLLFKKVLCVTLAAALFAGTMTGCGKKNNVDENSAVGQAAKNSKDYVYRAEQMDIGIDVKDGTRDIYLVGDTVYLTAYVNDGLQLITLDKDGNNLKSFALKETGNTSYGEFAFDKEGNIYATFTKYNWADEEVDDAVTYEGDEEGAVEGNSAQGTEDADEKTTEESTEEASEETATEEVSEKAPAEDSDSEDSASEDSASEDSAAEGDEEGEITYLIKMDKDGNELYKVPMNEGEVSSEEDYYYISGIVYTEDAGVIICSNKGIMSYTEDNGFKTLVDMQDKDNEFYGRSFTPQLGADGTVYVTGYPDSGPMEVRVFDTKTNKIGDAVQVTLNSFEDYSFLTGNGYDLYVAGDSALYGFDAASGQLTKLMDYLDSDLQATYAIQSLVAIDKDHFIASLPDEEYSYHLYTLTKVPADQIKDKKILTLASYYVDYSVRNQVIKFNKENEDYKIKIIDYSSYDTEEDYEAGQKQLNLDIASGNVPDIMFFRTESPIGSYINKGLFQDMTGFLAKDPDISEEDFLPNVLEAFKTNGKIYQLVPSFYVSTVATKESYVQGKDTITFAEADKLIQDTGCGYTYPFGMADRSNFLETGLALTAEDYIDWENKTCNFDSESFISFLEMCAKLPEKFSDDAWDEYNEAYYRDGKSLFNMTFLSDFRSYKRLKQGTFGNDMTYVGFPNDFGKNCSVIYPEYTICVSSRCSDTEGAWQLIKTFFTEEAQEKLEYAFPATKGAFDKLAKASMEKQYYMDGDEKVEYEDTYYIGDTPVTIDPLNDQDIKDVTDFICGINKVYTSNDSVNNIIQEEASAFFSGQKTAAEVAAIIQSRVSIYVNENS